jgi:hypothetical protein
MWVNCCWQLGPKQDIPGRQPRGFRKCTHQRYSLLDLTWRYCDTLFLSDTTCQMVGSIHRRENKVSHREVGLWTHQDAPSISTINPTLVMPSVGGRNLQTYPIQPRHPHISILMWAPLDEITTPPTSRTDGDVGAAAAGGSTQSLLSLLQGLNVLFIYSSYGL